MPNSLYCDLCDVYDEGEKPYLFISYSHEDTTRVVSAIRALQQLGYRIWYDMGISAGAQWPEDVADHIYGCDAMLAFMTPNAITSDNCREELFYGKKLKKKILLAYLDTCDLSHGMDMRLGTLQAIDRSRCTNDEDFYTRIAKAKILQPCRGEVEGTDAAEDPSVPRTAEHKAMTQFEQLQHKAEQGDAQAQAELGFAYRDGEIVQKDEVKAAYWFEKAAKKGVRYAQASLGAMYFEGQGVQKDMKQSVYWYQQAVDLGHGIAMNNLGWMYESGQGVDLDLAKASELYRKAAEAGCVMGMYNMGRIHENGIFVDQDWAEAFRWYLKGAEHNQKWCQKKLVQCYRKGLGVPIDEAEADRWQKIYEETT